MLCKVRLKIRERVLAANRKFLVTCLLLRSCYFKLYTYLSSGSNRHIVFQAGDSLKKNGNGHLKSHRKFSKRRIPSFKEISQLDAIGCELCDQSHRANKNFTH
jgi:hypothetical protein